MVEVYGTNKNGVSWCDTSDEDIESSWVLGDLSDESVTIKYEA